MSKTVMIVEDNELNMKLFHDLLEAHGYHPIGTRNGIEALDFARKHRPDSNEWRKIIEPGILAKLTRGRLRIRAAVLSTGLISNLQTWLRNLRLANT